MKLILSAALTAFILSACGGGGSGAPAVATAVVVTPPKTVLIEEYGDSTVQGIQVVNGVVSVTANSEPADLQRLLQARYGTSVTVSNQGVGGTEASQLLYGTDGVHPPFSQVIANSKAQIVTLNFAINDSNLAQNPCCNLMSEQPAEYWSIMYQLVQIAQQAGKTVVLVEPNPVWNPTLTRVNEYAQYMDGVGAQLNVPVVANIAPMLQQPNWQAMIGEDGTHPTDAGYLFKANDSFAVIASIVAGML